MKKFEVGKRYRDGALTFEVISRTKKTAKVAVILHEGKANEKIREIKKVKLNVWEDGEVFFHCDFYEVHA